MYFSNLMFVFFFFAFFLFLQGFADMYFNFISSFQPTSVDEYRQKVVQRKTA